jgi:hypothetical protein
MWVGGKIYFIDFSKLLTPKQTTEFILDRPGYVPSQGQQSVYVQMEPETFIKQEEYLIQNHTKYTYILTFNEKILHACPNAYSYVFGTSRFAIGADSKTLDDIKQITPDQKQFKLTSLFNDKLFGSGHSLRHAIFENQSQFHSELAIPCYFHVSASSSRLQYKRTHPEKNPILDKTKWPLFNDSQFHIAIENSRQKDYFTEKVCDALITYTIPIYYGCPNISEYFDTTGWIILEDVNIETALQKLATLTPDHYERHKDIVLKNYELCKKYIHLEQNLNEGLKKIPNFSKESS